jgi:plasmid stabilization system protein ParE
MVDQEKPDSDVSREVLGADLPSVADHLEHRFPNADSDQVREAIEDAVHDLADARITTFRPLLVEHNASDALRSEADSELGLQEPGRE